MNYQEEIDKLREEYKQYLPYLKRCREIEREIENLVYKKQEECPHDNAYIASFDSDEYEGRTYENIFCLDCNKTWVTRKSKIFSLGSDYIRILKNKTEKELKKFGYNTPMLSSTNEFIVSKDDKKMTFKLETVKPSLKITIHGDNNFLDAFDLILEFWLKVVKLNNEKMLIVTNRITNETLIFHIEDSEKLSYKTEVI